MRWAPDSRGRLFEAALGLFSEQGYTATTVPEIAARAGLTTRTFFRYFADKREVIFGGDEIPNRAARLVDEAAADLQPIDVVRQVLHRVAIEQFDGHHQLTAVVRQVIRDNDPLRDRDARKRDDMVRAVRAAFLDRGETPLRATVVAELGILVFHVALEEWVQRESPGSMTSVIDEVMALMADNSDQRRHRSEDPLLLEGPQRA